MFLYEVKTMINIWPFEYCGKVKLVDTDGNIFIGEAEDITDASDRSEYEKKENGITLNVDGRFIDFYQSEIASIEKL